MQILRNIKQILLREEDSDSSEVQISSLVSGNQSWFSPRAKCYPLYSLMLAVNRTQIDVLSLGCQSQEIEVNFNFSFIFGTVIP